MPTLDDEIRSQIDAFATELAAQVRRAALEAVTAALGAVPPTTAAQLPGMRGRGRPKKGAAPAAAAAKAPAAKAPAAHVKVAKAAAAPKGPAARKPAASKRALGQKRPPGELAKLTEKLGEHIKAHPGHRMETIGKALGVPTKELNLPVKKLLAAKRIRVEGQKRATEYFPV